MGAIVGGRLGMGRRHLEWHKLVWYFVVRHLVERYQLVWYFVVRHVLEWNQLVGDLVVRRLLVWDELVRYQLVGDLVVWHLVERHRPPERLLALGRRVDRQDEAVYPATRKTSLTRADGGLFQRRAQRPPGSTTPARDTHLPPRQRSPAR